MSELVFDITEIPFDKLDRHDASGFLSQMGAGQLSMGPALDFSPAAEPSESIWQNREYLLELLSIHNAEIGNDLSDETKAAIGGEGVFVIAGQQPGLFLGPNYAFLKAVTSVALARRLGELLDRPVIPAFWVASEDHDVSEVNHTWVNGEKFSCDHDFLRKGGPFPQVADASLGEFRDVLLAKLDAVLLDNDFKDEIMRIVREAGFENYADSFARQMVQLFAGQGLVMLDPVALRPMTSPVLANAVSAWPGVENAFEAGKQLLRDAKYQPPVEEVGLFEIVDGRREKVVIESGHAVLGGEQRSLPDAADWIREHPMDFSPNAALRPVLQDAVLPNLVTIGGPTELRYLWQIDPVYTVTGVRRSKIWPRVSATFIYGAVVKKAARVDLEGRQILQVLDVIEEIESDPPEVEHAGADALRERGKALLEAIDGLESKANAALVDYAKQSIEHQLDKLLDALHEEGLEEIGRSQKDLERVADEVYPKGKPQERIMSPYDLLNRFGLEMVEGLIEAVDPEKVKHLLIELRHEN